ncbi:Protein of unknown function [Lactobacillus delbrueckii subsp. bulgaricus]|nr:Protein of unknown function [Lactobacillus delbrueckii subsp. bulgaricus]CDR74639.1 Protein of unknown function [Lactobacillus delbrueckii subsp. bulgaricus]
MVEKLGGKRPNLLY